MAQVDSTQAFSVKQLGSNLTQPCASVALRLAAGRAAKEAKLLSFYMLPPTWVESPRRRLQWPASRPLARALHPQHASLTTATGPSLKTGVSDDVGLQSSLLAAVQLPQAQMPRADRHQAVHGHLAPPVPSASSAPGCAGCRAPPPASSTPALGARLHQTWPAPRNRAE